MSSKIGHRTKPIMRQPLDAQDGIDLAVFPLALAQGFGALLQNANCSSNVILSVS